MNVKKCLITKGSFNDKELRLLVSYDDKDEPLHIINLDSTKIGTVCEATVEKVLKDIDACILNLSIGEKGFIENKTLKPEYFIERHSDKKLVCQGDKFNVKISQDRKGVKPFSCDFVSNQNDVSNNDFIHFYLDKYGTEDNIVITDLDDFQDESINLRHYSDDSISLWQLYSLTKLLDSATSKVVHLKNGSNIVIEPTEALTVVDVNSSTNGGKGSAFDINKIALSEINRQLRLRSISGIIIIDLLKVSKAEENLLIEHFKNQLTEDYAIVTIHGFTNLGLLELTRSRTFAPFTI